MRSLVVGDEEDEAVAAFPPHRLCSEADADEDVVGFVDDEEAERGTCDWKSCGIEVRRCE